MHNLAFLFVIFASPRLASLALALSGGFQCTPTWQAITVNKETARQAILCNTPIFVSNSELGYC